MRNPKKTKILNFKFNAFSNFGFSASNFQGGFGLVEVLVGSSIIAAVLISLLGVAGNFIRVSHATVRTTQGVYLLEEGVEASRLIRDGGWTANIVPLSVGATYRFAWDTSTDTWVPTTTIHYIDGMFDRTFTLSDVYRNADDDIAGSGTLDPNTRLVTVTVSWRGPSEATTSKSISTYITNFFLD